MFKLFKKLFKKKRDTQDIPDLNIFEFPGWETLSYPAYTQACCKIAAGSFSNDYERKLNEN